jgi:hypothetical protein
MGAWTALGLVALRLHAPAAGRTATTVLAASAGNDVLQTAFSLLCERANAAREGTEQRQRPFSAPDERRERRIVSSPPGRG